VKIHVGLWYTIIDACAKTDTVVKARVKVIIQLASGGSLFDMSPENFPVVVPFPLIPGGLREKETIDTLSPNSMDCGHR